MKSNLPPVSLILLLLAASPLPAETKPLRDANLDFSPLETWGVKSYTLTIVPHGAPPDPDTIRTKTRSALSLGTAVEKKEIIVTDTMRMGLEVTGRITCRRESPLPVRSMQLTMLRDGETQKATVSILEKKGKAKISGQEEDKTVDFPADTVLFSTVCRIVTLLPREPGSEYSFLHYSPTFSLKVESAPEAKPYVVRSVGGQTLDLGAGESMECFLFEMRGLHQGTYRFFVDESGVLQRIQNPQTVFDLIRGE